MGNNLARKVCTVSRSWYAQDGVVQRGSCNDEQELGVVCAKVELRKKVLSDWSKRGVVVVVEIQYYLLVSFSLLRF